MARKKMRDDEAEMGRMIGSLERTGYRELIDEVRALAKAEGKTTTEKLAEIIKMGLNYEKYQNLTLADAMKVMDFIERAFNNIIYPMMYTAGNFGHEMQLEKLQKLALMLGFVPREQAERLIEEKMQEAYEAGRREAEERVKQQLQREGPLTKFIDKLSEVLAERLGEEVLARLIAEGKLDDFVKMLGDVALQAAAQALMEEGGGNGGSAGKNKD